MSVESASPQKRTKAGPVDPARASAIRAAIISHYAAHARTLPWRAPPGSGVWPDPYHVWLSEVMLQQTTVAAVIPYFTRFVARWPSVAALAAARAEDVLSAWAGLGYYSRARNLIACAETIVRVHAGSFPADVAILRALPGVGDYTAAAINAFAFGGDAIPIDANIERVVARLFAIDTPLPAAKPLIRAAAQRLWPDTGGGDFAQALMDLGAGICSSRRPDCGNCHAAFGCAAHHRKIAAALPQKPVRRVRPERQGRAQWIMATRDGVACVWLVRRPDKGLLGGMRALPGGEWTQVDSTDAMPDSSGGAVRHIFTHFALTLAVEITDTAALAVGEGEWWPILRLDEAGLPALYRRAAELAMRETT